MKTFFDRIGKTGTAVSLIFGIIVSIITIWQFFKSSTRHNLTGDWKLKFEVESSSYSPYIGETHTQKFFFNQADCAITGAGEKWEYNGRFLPYDMHRKVEYLGELDDDIFKATFKLFGLKRETVGIIEVTLTDGGKKMAGIFSGTAGNTKGTVVGEKIENTAMN
jgi:hypothetical protein